MSDLEDFEKEIRAQADRKIAAGRALRASVASVLEVQEKYRADYAEAVAAGFDEAELKRLGMMVDGVKLAPSRTPLKTRAGRGGRGKPRLGTRSMASGAPAAASAAAEQTAGGAEPDGAELSA